MFHIDNSIELVKQSGLFITIAGIQTVKIIMKKFREDFGYTVLLMRIQRTDKLYIGVTLLMKIKGCKENEKYTQIIQKV